MDAINMTRSERLELVKTICQCAAELYDVTFNLKISEYGDIDLTIITPKEEEVK